MIKPLLAVCLIALSGCEISRTSAGICTASETLRKAHAAALLEDGGPQSQDTGERLLTGFAEVC